MSDDTCPVLQALCYDNSVRANNRAKICELKSNIRQYQDYLLFDPLSMSGEKRAHVLCNCY